MPANPAFRSPNLCHAIARAVREISPAVRALDAEAIGTEIRNRVCNYWGSDHGLTDAEIAATAQDVKRNSQTQA